MSNDRLSASARTAAGLVSLAALSCIGIELTVRAKESGVAAALWSMARYFTFLTNAAVTAVLGAAALRGRWSGATLPAALTVWICATGLVYHVLLAPTNDPQGIRLLSDLGLHTAVPIGCFAIWAAYCPKDGLNHFGPLVWTLWPVVYAVYALLRGLVDGEFPYFFLDPAGSGMTVVIGYIIGLGLFFTLAGSLLVILTRLLGNDAVPNT